MKSSRRQNSENSHNLADKLVCRVRERGLSVYKAYKKLLAWTLHNLHLMCGGHPSGSSAGDRNRGDTSYIAWDPLVMVVDDWPKPPNISHSIVGST